MPHCAQYYRGLTEDANKGQVLCRQDFHRLHDRDGDGATRRLHFQHLRRRRWTRPKSQGFGADKVMMLDGGGSAQLLPGK
jgi:hypothetical protein